MINMVAVISDILVKTFQSAQCFCGATGSFQAAYLTNEGLYLSLTKLRAAVALWPCEKPRFQDDGHGRESTARCRATRAVSHNTARFTCIQPIQYICAEGCTHVCDPARGLPRQRVVDLHLCPLPRQRVVDLHLCPLPRQRVVDLHLCVLYWKWAVDLRPTRCCWTSPRTNPSDLRAWPAAGARQRGQNSAILPALPRQRVVDLHLCPSSWKRAVDLRTARCMLLDTPVLYGKCVPITRTRRSTRCSTTFIPPHCPRRSTRWGTQTSFTPRGPAAWHCARLWIRTLPGPYWVRPRSASAAVRLKNK